MKSSKVGNVNLVPVSSSTAHIRILFDLLQERRHPISSGILPGFDDHTLFVQNHPYRYWYLIHKDDKYLGSVYGTYHNVMGLSVERDITVLRDVIDSVMKLHPPLFEIKSIRGRDYCVNISPTNVELELALQGLGATLIQKTYRLRKPEDD